MNRAITVAFAVAAFAAPAVAEEIKPLDVVYDEYGAVATPLTTSAPDVENGKVLMNKGAGNCIACHQVTALADLPFHGEIGPSLDGVADRWEEADIRGIIANAKLMFEGTMMPAFYKVEGFTRIGDAYTGKALEGEVTPLLTAQEIEDVVAFLMTLKEE